ncbi:MOSC domain-containing protein [Paenibacillus contaminans]|nr:MOSC domain-containing protein [Paenibacillus contaminans]
MTIVGSVREMFRYPVKSFAGERLESACSIEPYGLFGDRLHAFIDETKEGWNSFITARGIPAMLNYRAIIEEKSVEDGEPRVIVTAPDGKEYHWDEELLQEIQRFARMKISMKSYRTESGEGTGVDDSHILIVTNRSLLKLEALWGKKLDPRRFRANLIVSLNDEEMGEAQWIGKRLSIGSAELLIDKGCERCSMITLHPDSLERDSSLLKIVNDKLNLTFGVYASVVRTGVIAIGDEVRLTNP